MTTRALSHWFATASAAGLALGVWVTVTPLTDVQMPGPAVAPVADSAESATPAADSLAHVIAARDAFRIGRRPATVAYDLVRAGQPSVPQPPKPVLVLTGIVWDSHGNPSAVIDGLPGAGGPRVVRAGDMVGPLRVRRIERERVVIAGLDTVWTLTVREPWR